MHFAIEKHARSALLCLSMTLLSPAVSSAAVDDCNLTPVQASVVLYDRMSAKDLSGVLQLIPLQGLSEIGTEGSIVHHLDSGAFERLFRSDVSIDLRAESLQEQQIGNLAIVTGVRTGAITANNATPKFSRQVFTMIWLKDKDACKWQVHHLHLSVS